MKLKEKKKEIWDVLGSRRRKTSWAVTCRTFLLIDRWCVNRLGMSHLGVMSNLFHHIGHQQRSPHLLEKCNRLYPSLMDLLACWRGCFNRCRVNSYGMIQVVILGLNVELCLNWDIFPWNTSSMECSCELNMWALKLLVCHFSVSCAKLWIRYSLPSSGYWDGRRVMLQAAA